MKTVLLASGGLDSTVLATMLRDDEVIHLSVDYGQRHATRELAAARSVAKYFDVEHVEVGVDLDLLAHSRLTGNPHEPGSWEGENTVVPGRNSVLLSLAVSLASSRRFDAVWIGCNANDYEVYADCRPEFIQSWNDLAFFQHGLSVRAPLVNKTKRDIGALARNLFAPVNLTWSCYRGGAWPCEDCGACQQRKEALGVYDH